MKPTHMQEIYKRLKFFQQKCTCSASGRTHVLNIRSLFHAARHNHDTIPEPIQTGISSPFAPAVPLNHLNDVQLIHITSSELSPGGHRHIYPFFLTLDKESTVSINLWYKYKTIEARDDLRCAKSFGSDRGCLNMVLSVCAHLKYSQRLSVSQVPHYHDALHFSEQRGICYTPSIQQNG